MPTSSDAKALLQPSDVVVSVVGEIVFDLIEDATGEDIVFLPRVGGAPLNVAVGASRLGVNCELITPVAEDGLALEVLRFLEDEGVQVSGFPGGPTTPLAIVQGRGEGGLTFSFYGDPREPWTSAPDGLVANGSIVHLGSAPLMTNLGYRAVRRMVDAHAGRVTLDPNYRPSLVPDAAKYRRRLEALLPRVSLIKLSDEDARGIWGAEDSESVALRLVDHGAEVVIVTSGALGAHVATREGAVHVPTRPVAVADTTGAGDSFMAAVLSGLVQQPQGVADWSEVVARANRAAGLTCQAVGGASAMPTAAALTAEELAS